MNIINIFGVNIPILNKRQVLKKIERFLSDGGQHQIVTPNPEFLLRAGKDEEFFYILNKADLAVPDGIGLKFAAWVMGKNIYRYTGADLIKNILQIAQDKKLKVAVLNWRGGLSDADDIKKVLEKKYSGLQFVAEDIGREIPVETHCNASLQEFHPDILFVALGAPWQEKWIYHNLPKLPFVKIAIGVGGAFDFLADKIKRAPKFLRILGLEWLWRIFNQPAGKKLWRIKRIYSAVIIFPWKFFKWKFVNCFLFRHNVACLLFKKEMGKYKILLVERENESGHWQLPQGGTDGENLKIAGERELTEEIGTNKFSSVKSFSNVYKYKFGDKKSRANIKSKFIEGYKGQKQGLFIAEFLGEDNDIKINFWDHSNWKWVDSEDLISAIHLERKKATEIFLEKFNEIDK